MVTIFDNFLGRLLLHKFFQLIHHFHELWVIHELKLGRKSLFSIKKTVWKDEASCNYFEGLTAIYINPSHPNPGILI